MMKLVIVRSSMRCSRGLQPVPTGVLMSKTRRKGFKVSGFINIIGDDGMAVPVFYKTILLQPPLVLIVGTVFHVIEYDLDEGLFIELCLFIEVVEMIVFLLEKGRNGRLDIRLIDGVGGAGFDVQGEDGAQTIHQPGLTGGFFMDTFDGFSNAGRIWRSTGPGRSWFEYRVYRR